MTRRRYLVLDVFTDRRFGGNPLAVVPEADGLDGAAMQRVANEFNLSETTFVLPPDNPSELARVRIFTPRAELPFAGHPTVGTALALARLGRVPPASGGADGTARFILGELAGPVPVTVAYSGGEPAFASFEAPRRPEAGPRLDPGRMARLLGLPPDAVATGGPMPAVASCGIPFLVVELGSLEALGAARIAEPGLMPQGANGAFLVVRAGGGGPGADPGERWRARMYAPGHGIAEDPATGSAAAAFAGLLGLSGPASGEAGRRLRLRIEQGVEMGRPSLIEAEAHLDGAGGVERVTVGGGAVPVAEGWIETE